MLLHSASPNSISLTALCMPGTWQRTCPARCKDTQVYSVSRYRSLAHCAYPSLSSQGPVTVLMSPPVSPVSPWLTNWCLYLASSDALAVVPSRGAGDLPGGRCPDGIVRGHQCHHGYRAKPATRPSSEARGQQWAASPLQAGVSSRHCVRRSSLP